MNIGYTLTANTIGKERQSVERKRWTSVCHLWASAYVCDRSSSGVWQVTPVKHNWDHGDFVGTDTSEVRISKEELEDFWDNMFEDMVRNEKVTDKQ